MRPILCVFVPVIRPPISVVVDSQTVPSRGVCRRYGRSGGADVGGQRVPGRIEADAVSGVLNAKRAIR
jgi:hypothetical protein